MMTKQQMEQRSETDRKEGFRKWMQEPMTRALLSRIPPCEDLELLLQATFEDGFAKGSGSIAISFIDAVMKAPPR